MEMKVKERLLSDFVNVKDFIDACILASFLFEN